jgi:hypothetical protein
MPAQQAFLIRDDELPHDDFSCQGASAVRLLAVPEVAPPFDGDLPGSGVTMPTPGGRGKACPDGGPWGSGDQNADMGRGLGMDSGPGAGPDAGGDWPERFARLLTEALTGSRPARQLLPWTTERARAHLRKLTPAFNCAHRPRVLRVITTRPARDVVEMTVIVRLGPRTRALAVRLEAVRLVTARQGTVQRMPSGGASAARWLCTDIEAA